jgi:DNA-binding FrmR family transcriptional regulator
MSIQKNNSIVEEALLQMKAVEEAINENAKGILASTMKEEISELVRESLRDSKKSKRSLVEQEEDGEEVIATTDDTEIGGTEQEDDTEDFDETEFDMNLSGGMEPEISMPDDNEDERPPLNMTQAPIADVMRVFQAMGDEDGIMIQKDETGNIHLTDNNKNSEY